MSKYRKRPVVIEAFQWTGGPDQTEDPEWIVEALDSGAATIIFPNLYIRTLEGEMTADVGDWIIKGIQGELYPCKPDIFEATYDLVDGEEETK